jgi:hypothetical protein
VKWAGWVVAALTLCLCTLLGWRVIDCAVASDDAYSEVEHLGKRAAMALEVIQHDWIGRPESELAEFAQRMKQEGALVKRDGDVVEIDDLVFRTNDRSVVEVRYLD